MTTPSAPVQEELPPPYSPPQHPQPPLQGSHMGQNLPYGPGQPYSPGQPYPGYYQQQGNLHRPQEPSTV